MDPWVGDDIENHGVSVGERDVLAHDDGKVPLDYETMRATSCLGERIACRPLPTAKTNHTGPPGEGEGIFPRDNSTMKKRNGFTLVELLVVIAIIAMLVTLLLPAVQAAREAARRTQCLNGMRQIVLAWLNHESAQGFLPSSGWGWRWQGDPDRGFGASQPGGWAYDILPYMEQQDIHDLGRGLPDAQKGQRMLVAVSTPIPVFNCPTRREARTYPKSRGGDLADNLRECAQGQICRLARSDYQANSGNVAVGETRGPTGNRQTDFEGAPYHGGRATGVTHHVSETRLGQIVDGTSKTLCVGEKYLNVDTYVTGTDPADDQNIFLGIDRDVNGYTASATSSGNIVQQFKPRQDRPGMGLNWTFGSAHQAAMNAVFCDGSGRSIEYDVDPFVFWAMGGREDGPAVPTSN